MPIAATVLILGLAAGCSSPQERAAKAEERSHEAHEGIAKKRLELVDQYQKCVKDSGEDKQKVEACDSYLRSAEALK
jgi:hypothetical protein